MDKARQTEEDLDYDVDPIPYHYVWIKDLSKLLNKQNSKHDGMMYFCDRCLHGFHSGAKHESHKQDCKEVTSCRVKMPERRKGKNGENPHLFNDIPARWAKIRQGLDIFRTSSECVRLSNGEV